jgi:hypothetical protein
VTQKITTLEASQALCVKESYTPKQEGGGGEVIISMLEYDDNGTLVSREDTETTELCSLPPGSFNILEDLSFIE